MVMIMAVNLVFLSFAKLLDSDLRKETGINTLTLILIIILIATCIQTKRISATEKTVVV